MNQVAMARTRHKARTEWLWLHTRAKTSDNAGLQRTYAAAGTVCANVCHSRGRHHPSMRGLMATFQSRIILNNPNFQHGQHRASTASTGKLFRIQQCQYKHARTNHLGRRRWREGAPRITTRRVYRFASDTSCICQRSRHVFTLKFIFRVELQNT